MSERGQAPFGGGTVSGLEDYPLGARSVEARRS